MHETASLLDDADADPYAGLLLDVADGDREAFDGMYSAASAGVLSICLRGLSGRAEAEDVLQEAFATIWYKAGQFDPARAGAMAWMSTIARNRAIDRLRAPGHAMRRSAIALGDELADAGASPLAEAQSADDRTRLLRCLQALDDRRRGLIRTAFFEGATYEELASRTGAPLGSVKSWIRRGLLQLRACLEA